MNLAAKRYTPQTLRRVVQTLTRQLSHIKNEDSRFSVASIIIAKLPGGEISIFSSGNTELGCKPLSNCCAERNILRNLRAYGRDVEILDVFIMGKDTLKSFKSQDGKLTPCCHLCLEELLQFTSKDPDRPTLIHQVPLAFPDIDSYNKAAKNIVSDPIFDLVPPILRYDAEQYLKNLVDKKVRGIFHVDSAESLLSNLKKHAAKLFGKDFKLQTGKSFNIPLNGDVTELVKAAGINLHNINSPEELTKMNSLLGLVRNIYAHKHFDNDKKTIKSNITHIETAICATTDGKFYISSSLAGKQISRQRTSLDKVLELAKGEDHDHRVSHLFLMGDGTKKDKKEPIPKRQYPLVGEIYEMCKRSPFEVNKSPTQNHSTASSGVNSASKKYKMETFCFAPNVPGKQVHPDYREQQTRLSAETSNNIVTRLALAELVKEGSTFVTAKQGRTEMARH